jgi:2-polyprenyl-3-methyl-5-hydroxy-6-metoxy-1,4-benzoquinol methylase
MVFSHAFNLECLLMPGFPQMPDMMREWERAEVERSDKEALHRSAGRLRASERQVARYLNPPLDSVFPLEYAFALLGNIQGLTVLDFGCGTGENSLLLATRGARVIGVDISASLIQLANRRLETNGLSAAAKFVVGSCHDIPLSSKSVDIIVGIAVLHHLNMDLAAREVFRVLKDGGRAIFQEPVRDSRVLRALRRLVPYRAPDVSSFERPLTASELRRFAARFQTDAVRAFSLPFVNVAQVVAPLRQHIDRVYRLDGAALRRLPMFAPLAGIRVMALSKPTTVPSTESVQDNETTDRVVPLASVGWT